jgi:hypothetical protein
VTQKKVDPAVLAALVRTLDERPDPLHVDVTPSVLALIDLGLPGAEAVLDRLNAPERLTRMRAQRVVEAVLAHRFGWRAGVGYPTAEAEQQARAVATSNGYNADASELDRLAAIERWRAWIDAERARKQE